MKIFYKLTLGFLTVALLIWITGYFAINQSKEALQKTFIENAESLAVEILDHIDINMHSRIETFQEYSQNVFLQEAILKSNQDFEKLDGIQAYIINKDQEWISTEKEEVTPFMQDIMNNKLSKELLEKIKFYGKRYSYKVFGEVFVTNKYGANIAQTGKTTDYRQDDEEWWQIAKRGGFYGGDLEFDESVNIDSTVFGIRVDDENGNFIGVMKIILNIEEAINMIKKMKLSGMHLEHKDMKYRLIPKEGILIYSTEEGEKRFDNVSNLFEPGYFDDTLPAKISHKRSGEVLLIHTHSRGHKDFKGFGWVLTLEHKTAEIFAPVAKLETNIFTASLSVTIFGLLIGFFTSTSIAKNIEKLKDTAIKVGRGNLDVRVDVESKDEIGKLARAFNQMIEDLKTTTVKRDELSKEVVERKKIEDKLRTMSLTDELTGLYNRRGFFTLAQQQLKIAKRQKQGLFMLYADIDNLKWINDTLGHNEGDIALIDIANILKINYRESDIIARLGGDEFAVIPIGTTGDSIEIITARFQEKLDINNSKTNRSYKLSISVGIAYYDPESPCPIDELLAQADKLMYEQKMHKKMS